MNGESNGALLQTRDLACGYSDQHRTVLCGVNLAMRRGRFICIIGPNGAGKTTLLRTLAGLLPSISGDVRLEGAPIGTMHALERARRLSVVLTHLETPGYLTVERFVELGRHPHTGMLARLRDADLAAIDEALEQTGMAGFRDRWMGQISDGERQRAAVARALAQAAEIMILDEPTAFLDVAARASIMSTLRRIAHTTDRLIVTTSHDVELVLRMADLLVMIGADGTIHVGSPEDLVLSGAIAALFPDDSLRFDPASGTFRLPHPTGTPVRVVGSGIAAEWTGHALERIGRPVVRPGETDERARTTVDVGSDGRWTVSSGRESRVADSIEELAELLRE